MAWLARGRARPGTRVCSADALNSYSVHTLLQSLQKREDTLLMYQPDTTNKRLLKSASWVEKPTMLRSISGKTKQIPQNPDAEWGNLWVRVSQPSTHDQGKVLSSLSVMHGGGCFSLLFGGREEWVRLCFPLGVSSAPRWFWKLCPPCPPRPTVLLSESLLYSLSLCWWGGCLGNC